MQQQRSGKVSRAFFRLFLAAALLLLPGFIAGLRVLRGTADSVVLEVTNVKPYSNNPSIAIIEADVRNEGSVAFDRIEGELYLFRGDELLYSCRASYRGKVSPGAEKKIEFTVSNLYDAEPLLAYPVSEMSYTWITGTVRFIGFGFLFTHSFSPERSVPWPVIAWLIPAAGALITGILGLRRRKESEESPAGSAPEAAAVSSEASFTHAAEAAQAASSSVDKDALNSAQRSLVHASWTASSARSQGQTQSAELQDHFKRSAFGDVLRESAGLEGRDREAFVSAQNSYEAASRFEASYRASGSIQKQNAEHAQYRRESAFADMLEAVAEKDGRRSDDFDSAKKSYEHESFLASNYRASGSAENAAEAEHRQRLAYANMLKNTSDLDRRASEAYSSAQRSYESASRSAASYRRQGMVQDAERAEHHMRLAEANMLKVKAEAKGNGRAFEDARKSFENASRHYMEYKSRGQERDANREKDYMDRAYAKMISYT